MLAEGFCDFRKTVPRKEWIFGASNKNRKLAAPSYGAGQQSIPKGPERAIVRCPKCNKRLRLRANYCIGGEFTNWYLPDHKPRVTRSKGPKRQTRRQSRGR
jgi:hypothetical protein